MTPANLDEIIDVLDHVDPGDRDCYLRRQAVVAELHIDEATIVAKVKMLLITKLTFQGRRFDVDIRGVDPTVAVVIGALNADEQLLDLVAWPVGFPQRLGTLLGRVAMLGQHQLDDDRAANSLSPLPVYRSAIDWISAGCRGVVPIDPERSARLFLDCPYEAVLATDKIHARDLAMARAALADRSPAILVAETARRAA